MPKADPGARSESRIAEFSALRQEIEYRSNAQLALISLNLTAIGTLGGFVLSNQADPLLLLLLPILCPAIGMLYLDHAFVIRTIGDYIQNVLGFLWEEIARAQERRKVLRFLVFGTPILLMFVGVPVYALIFLFPLLTHYWAWCLWIFGAALVTAFLWFWITFLTQPLQDLSGQRQR